MRDITGDSVNFKLHLQGDNVDVAELIDLATSTNHFRWTTANATLVSSGYTYDPLPGGTPNGGPEQGTDLAVGNMDFVVAKSGDIGTIINGFELEGGVLTVRRVITSTPDLGSLTVLRARIGNYNYDRQIITGTAQDLFGDLQAEWPYIMYQDTCAWRFGSTGCTKNTSSLTVTGSLDVANSNALTVRCQPGFITNSWAAGALERGRVTITTGANSGQVRSIRSNSGDAIDLSHSLPFPYEASVGFAMYPGCRKRLIDDCTSKYNNAANFLGLSKWMPTQESVL